MEPVYIIGLLVAVALVVVVWFIMTMNAFAHLLVKVTESDSGIEVALTKRYDTLTKVLDVTKAYARHESETLAQIVRLRKGMSPDEKTAANRKMDEMTGGINILAESYPELRSSENFKELQGAIAEAEEHLQAARRIYNMNVSAFNQLLVTWPASIVGNARGHVAQVFFQAEEAKKEDLKMTF
ncbi:LemA family protein [Bilophila wadsworthia]|uniref:LemA family protein n=1 Tax=Bilophila wadsworthia TaxID=35833 RepID=UPI002674C952|nr:LemA family protein [Bilophila wadsworthia]